MDANVAHECQRPGIDRDGLGGFNQRLVLDAIRRTPGIALVELAEQVGMTRQGVMGILSPLLEGSGGLVRELEREPSGRGRPPRRFAFDGSVGRAIGLTLEHEAAAAACIDLDGTILAEAERTVDGDRPEDTADTLASLWREMVEASHGAPIFGVGLATMGPIDVRRGLITQPPRRPGWQFVPITTLVGSRIGRPVFFDNSATAAALGEAWAGSVTRDIRSFLYLFIGFGTGGAIVGNGRLIRGETFNAGEIGHVTVFPGGPECGCGGRGCLECYASIEALRRMHPGARAETAQPAEVEPWLEQASDALAIALTSCINLLDPGAVVIGGRLSQPLLEALVERTAAKTRAVAYRGRPVEPPILAGLSGIRASAIGAASLPLHDAFVPLPEGAGLSRHVPPDLRRGVQNPAGRRRSATTGTTRTLVLATEENHEKDARRRRAGLGRDDGRRVRPG
jgi:predicted NBD/HSP70 family sugar kinase